MSLIVDIKKKLGAFKLTMSFEADEGVLGLLGPSGCGKSLTLRCIAGIDKPDEGVIELNGVTFYDSKKNINLSPQVRKVGYLFQNYALFPNMNVKSNIMSGIRKGGANKEERFEEIVKLMQIEGLNKHYPAQLSGGQQQRVALARIFVNKPDMLMLDEPFSALDAHLRGQLRVRTKELLSQYGGLSILVTHSRDEAYQLCDEIALMQAGRILENKPTKQLFANPETVSGAIMTGCKNISAARKTGEYEVEAIDWGIRLATQEPVGEELCAVGVRGHYFNEKTKQNRFEIRIINMVEELFEWNIQFRYAGQSIESNNLWWRIPKDRKPQSDVTHLGVAGVNVLPLYKE